MAHNASARKERRQADMGSRESTAVAAAAEDGEVFTGPLNLFTAPPPTEETNTLSTVMKWSILGLICVISFAIRLFAVVRWESVIHEFDPYFNYRATKYLAEEGFSSFLNWQDDRTWHPIGRVVGGTVYPGLMVTAGVMHYLLNLVNITMNVRNICVFLAPLFAANTAIATYLMTSEVTGRSTAGLIAAAMVGIVPSYISRSVAGSYDNEGVAIFALIFTFYLWVKAVVTGRLIWGMAVALAYFYMVAAWGGYVFIINVIPIYTVVMIAAGRYSPRLYIAYSTFYVVGSLLSMQVPFVGFNVVKQAESAASHGVFVMIQLVALYAFVTKQISGAVIRRLLWLGVAVVIVGSAALLIAMQLLGYTQWTGRSLTLLDPTYAKKYIPIIASVSEHQPTSWTSFFFDLHVAVPLAPVGLYFLFQRLDGTQGDARIFMIIYGTISWYFAGVMVRLMLTLAPAACMLGAIGFSGLLSTFSAHLKIAWRGQAAAKEAPARAAEVADKPAGAGAGAAADASGSVAAAAGVARASKQAAAKEAAASPSTMPPVMSLAVLAGTGAMLLFYTLHATYVSSEAYSSPSIVLASKRADGSRVIFDDFREAYYWLRQNTEEDAKIMSWWDYGYQMTSMANRTVFVDNNTWNNTHIATVGRAMSTTEEDAYPVMESLDVDYILAVYGGMTGYQSDDINKFLWMVRIGGGVFPSIKESDYFAEGQYRMDKGGSPVMLNSLMYKLCYYRFDEISTQYGRPAGFDLARNVEVGHKGIQLHHIEEVFTSEHWIVRIYKRHKLPNRDGQMFNAIDAGVDRFGRQADALTEGPRPRQRLPLWPAPGSTRGNVGTEPAKPAVRYVGCYKFEHTFGADRVYGGGSAGASVSVARAAATAAGKRYFALARVGGDGHSFSFDGPLPHTPDGGSTAGCRRACGDDKDYVCGCSDAACTEEPIEPGHDNVRRWAVYEVVPEGSAGAVAGGAGGGAKPAAARRAAQRKSS